MLGSVRAFFIAVLVLALGWTTQSLAAEYPERNVTVIVPFPAGGASDTTARLISAKVAERLNQAFIVENRAGANGAFGATALKQAAPDGYTLLVGSIGVFAINPALIKDLKYDPLEGFRSSERGSVRTPNVLVVNPNVPAKTVAELIAHLKANPRQGDVCFIRHRIFGSSHRRSVLAEDRHHPDFTCRTEAAARHQRPDRGPRQRVFPESRRRRPADQGWHTEGAWPSRATSGLQRCRMCRRWPKPA